MQFKLEAIPSGPATGKQRTVITSKKGKLIGYIQVTKMQLSGCCVDIFLCYSASTHCVKVFSTPDECFKYLRIMPDDFPAGIFNENADMSPYKTAIKFVRQTREGKNGFYLAADGVTTKEALHFEEFIEELLVACNIPHEVIEFDYPFFGKENRCWIPIEYLTLMEHLLLKGYSKNFILVD